MNREDTILRLKTISADLFNQGVEWGSKDVASLISDLEKDTDDEDFNDLKK